MITNKDFWDNVQSIIREDFPPRSLETLDYYADLFISGKCIFNRFSPQEQHGCSAGGSSHVVATIIAGAETEPDPNDAILPDFKKELKRAAQQAQRIEKWAKLVGIWIENVDSLLSVAFGREISEGGEAKVYDNGATLVKSIGLDYYIQPLYALDRISLHNAYFPETALQVIGFGKDSNNEFKIIVEQAFVEGTSLTELEIRTFVESLGFELRNIKNWTYATPQIYLSDMHDENLIKSASGTVYVIDCDIRINTPELRQGGIRHYSNDITFFQI